MQEIKTNIAFLFLLKIFFLSNLILPFVAIGQLPHKEFENIFFGDWQSNNAYLSMLQDHLGFIWLGTHQGLVRYDGYSHITYKPDRDDPHAIKNGFIATIIESKDGKLWIGSGWGLHYFNRDTEHFTNIVIDSNRINKNPLYPWIVHYLYEDKKGHIWTISGEERKLHRYDPVSKKVHAVHFISRDKEQIKVAKVHNWWNQAPIEEDGNGNLWIGTYRGLVKYELEEEKLTLFSTAMPEVHDFKNDTIYALLIEKDSILWMGTQAGMTKFDLAGERFLPCHFERDFRASITANSPVYDLRMAQNDKELWIFRSATLEKTVKDQKLIKTLAFQPRYELKEWPWNMNRSSFHWIGEDNKGDICFIHNMNQFKIYNYDCSTDLVTTSLIEFEDMNRYWGKEGYLQAV